MISYSATTGGFYDAALHGDTMPADAVPISAARHRRLLALQAGGAKISARGDGLPQARCLVRSLTDQRATAIAAIKAEAARRIQRVAPLWRQMNDIADVTLMSADQLAARDVRQAAIRDIRAASDLIEVPIATATAAELRALDIAADPHWPNEA